MSLHPLNKEDCYTEEPCDICGSHYVITALEVPKPKYPHRREYLNIDKLNLCQFCFNSICRDIHEKMKLVWKVGIVKKEESKNE